MTMTMTEPAWSKAHAEALSAGQPHYRDPTTGYRVFTEIGLEARGECCGCGCRHCPWAHEAVAMSERAQRIVRPALLLGTLPTSKAQVIFWSGGKDSFLALRQLLREGVDPADLVLLTTFGLPKRIVAHQELPISAVVAQAEAMQLPLLGVPLAPGSDYIEVLTDTLGWLASQCGVAALMFGDLHLEHIRQWREEALAPVAAELGAKTIYPIWERDYADLLVDFEASGVQANLCAAPDPAAIAPVKIGAEYGRGLVDALPKTVDAFGERGEFHTYVQPATLTPVARWFTD